MTITRKWLIIGLMAICLLAYAPVVGAETTTAAGMTDINGHWAHEEIAKLAQRGVVHPDAAGLFRPDDPITRAEMFKMIVAAKMIKPVAEGESHFADLSADSWLVPYAETAYRLGILDGVSENGLLYLHPDEPVQKQELVSALLRAKGVSGEVNQLLGSEAGKLLEAYPDQADLLPLFKRPFAYALMHQIVHPYQDGTLRPAQLATRAEAAFLAATQLLPSDTEPRLTVAGMEIPYEHMLTVESTAFIEQNPTYLEWPVREGIVAVDPEVIPLGTHLYIEGYGYAVAADIGSGVKEMHVDVFLPSLEAALAYGRQKDTKVYLLD
ncbi:S-layer homology domain-containing protein [Brevibacillus fulvus]|uniref:3D (Asp-Asp-Asp) domain-containing protein n=1 Tax=Brevibacillus fulvus TaxID=1125967 RepID=A0A938Y0D5_9BACL|nr:S-layer homology domain-containing protein [Brevibacillus fulvus]MBM7591005.1 3D (Asp-Asp-Asp) domain-containing protein [Brevibacillus fulvus]